MRPDPPGACDGLLADGGMTSAVIHRVRGLDLPVGPADWPFAQARRAEIEAHFAKEQRDKPKLWNGRVLIGRNPVFADQQFGATRCSRRSNNHGHNLDYVSYRRWTIRGAVR